MEQRGGGGETVILEGSPNKIKKNIWESCEASRNPGYRAGGWIVERLRRHAAEQVLPAYRSNRSACGRKSGRRSGVAAFGRADDFPFVSRGSHRVRQRFRTIMHLWISALGGTASE